MITIARKTVPGTTSTITVTQLDNGRYEAHRSLDGYHGIKPFSSDFATEQDARRSANELWLGSVEARGPMPTMLEMAAASASRPAPIGITEGFWADENGEVFKVQQSQQTGRLYGKRLELGRFSYFPGTVNHLRQHAARPLTLEHAKSLGKLYGVCVICGATLTNEESIEAGIGPVCAGKL